MTKKYKKNLTKSVLPLLSISLLTACNFKNVNIERKQISEAQEVQLSKIEDTSKAQNNQQDSENIKSITPAPVAVKPIETSLWDYMANRQSLSTIKHSRISQFEKTLLKHPHLLKIKADLAAPYLHYIIQELEKRKMPLELAFTPMVESNFDPLAHSVVQAAGLWQFMPRTAKGFGLTINDWYDGRRDIVASTQAALNYYQYLNKMFKGDWLLTVAAYNYGEGNVLKAIKKNKKSGRPTDYWSLQLPKETLRHIPKWIALSNILINHKQFNLPLASINNAPVFASVTIQAPANLAQLAKLTGLDKKSFYRLNPAFNKLFIPAQHKSADILVPVESLEQFEHKVQNSSADIFKVSFSYQVKSGDNLSVIAKKNNTNVKAIKALNNLQTDFLKIGQMLKLPGMVEINKEEQAFFSTLNKYQKRRRYQIYKVRSGDSLWKIAKKFKVSTRKIAKWNSLSANKILRIGQSLKIWPRS